LFTRQIQKYETERTGHTQAIKTLEQRINSRKPLISNASASKWANLIKQHINLESLDAETLLLLIDKIIVSETQYIEGQRVCDIQIIYNYAGFLDGLELDEGRVLCGEPKAI
jgi:hypothetical protein